MNKAELLRCLKEQHQQSLALLQMVEPEAVIYEETGWRVKDLMAHVATWDAETLRSFYAFRRGTEYSIPAFRDVDDFNAYAATARMDETVDYILGDWQATRQWMLILFNAMNDADFDAEMTHPSGKRGTARQLAQEICEHEALHMDEIRAKLKVN